MLFRSKVKSKFNPQITKILVNNKGKESVKPTYISFLPPPILAKTPKEVNEISKYFKKNNSLQRKSYAQASFKSQNSNIAMNILKIKKMFPKLQNQKIDQIQKIINSSESKPKPCINITTKGSSCKQIIVSMSNKIARRYIKDASTYIISINCVLKTIKLNIMADFICIKDKGIVISTNNVTSPFDLQEIEKCVKSSLLNDADQISLSRLPQSKSYLKIVGIPYLNK